ncbi:hypothetical protein [Deinococcus sp.]|uniref:hypothetical protein n=1 Tax=Deinococcus sp. TaxID=47478 RepID=UPI0025BCD65C|nr:hypothetical protein [Deinococcus sp.]
MNRSLTLVLTLALVASASAQTTVPVSPLPLPPLPAPQTTETNAAGEQRVSLPFALSTVQLGAGSLLLAQPLPQGVTYQPGSAQLNGQALPDPLRGRSGTLYWQLTPAQLAPLVVGDDRQQLSGELGLVLEGAEAAMAALPAAQLQVLEERGQIRPILGLLDERDWMTATPLAQPETISENPGRIKLPLDGTDYASLDRVTIRVEGPLGEPPVPVVNGQPVPATQVGRTVTDPVRGVQQLDYYGVPIRPGVNTITLGDQTVRVRLAGPTSRYDIEPLQLRADGVTPLRLRVRTFDALGVATQPDRLTLRTNLEPLRPDAFPTEAGYQVALDKGQGIVELRPQTTPTTLQLDVVENDRVVRQNFEVRPDSRSVGVGMVSATLGLGSDGSLSDRLDVRARAYYEGVVGAGKLYVAADKDGLPNTTANLSTARNINYGDASQEVIPLRGRDPVAVSYDHPSFRAEYRQTATPMTVLPMTETLTALTLTTKAEPRLAGFVALVPTERVTDERLTPNGTRLLRLSRGGVVVGSQLLTLIEVGSDDQEANRRTLNEGIDYSLDPETGVVTLARGLDRVSASLNEQYVLASYRLLDGGSNRRLAYGAQVEQTGTAGSGTYSVGMGVTRVDSTTTFGVAGRYEQPELQVKGRVMASGGVLATASVSSRPAQRPGNGNQPSGGDFSVRYQSAGYAGLERGAQGLQADGRYDLPVSPRLGLRIEGSYGRALTTTSGSVGAQLNYQFRPFSVGAGLRYGFGSRSGLGLSGSVAYREGRVAAEVVHTTPISGTLLPTTDFRVDYRLTEQVKLSLRDTYTWGEGNTGVIGLNSTVGRTNYVAAYELANSSGQENRARFGVSTTLPLSERLGLGLRGAYLWNVDSGTSDISAGADLDYRADTFRATLGTDFSVTGGKLTTVLRGGVSGDLNPRLNLAADATAEFGARQGQKLALGYAYRSGQLNSLGYARYVAGSLANGDSSLTAGASAEYRPLSRQNVQLALRAGADMRVTGDRDSLTVQPYAGVTAAFNDRIQVGGWGRALLQPATSTTLIGYGVEAGYRVLPGTWLNVGYNIQGFDGIGTGNLYTRPGAYVRLDLTLDETLNGVKK